MPSTSLSRIAANTSGRRSPMPLQIRRERRGAGRVVGGVEQHLAAIGQAPRVRAVPATNVREARRRWRRHGDRRRVEQLEHPHGDDGVVDLMRAGERERAIAVVAHRRPQQNRCRSSAGCVGSTVGRPPRRSARRSRRSRAIAARASGGIGPTTTGTPGLMMPAFSRAISRSVEPRYCS